MARPDPYLPWPGNPRRFYAMAMPNGDKRLGIEGQLVFVQERRVGLKELGNVLTRAEAEALHDELGHALRAFDLARDLARDVAAEVGAAGVPTSSCLAAGQQERPSAYLGPYPIRGETLADVGFIDASEAA